MKVLLNLLLLFVTVLLVVVLTPVGLLAKIIVAIKTKSFDCSWFMRLALSLDQLGNVICDDLFNWLLVSDSQIHPFGDEDETVSSVLGKNYLVSNLTVYGSLLSRLLNLLDPNHSVNAIGE